jgi:gliding motility-associated-like protein
VNAWVWSFADSLGVIKTQNGAHIFTNPGVNNAMLIVSIDSNTICLGTKQKTIFVLSRPTAYFKTSAICQSLSVTLIDSSYSVHGFGINKWWWNLGNGSFSVQQNPTVVYNNLLDTVLLAVTDSKGCISDTLKQSVVIIPKPVAKFGYSSPVCYNLPVLFSDSSAGSINKWSWIYNGNAWSTQQNASLSFTTFNPKVGLVVTNNLGCVSDTAFKTLLVNTVPSVTISFKDACKNAAVNFTAVDNSGTVSQWKWTFGDGVSAGTQNAQHIYTANGTYKVKLFATASNGCYSDSLTGDIKIYSTNVFAGNDTIAAAGQPVQLNATGGLSYSWTPALPLSNPNIANPVATLTATQTFTVKAFTPEGCESFDDITVKIYKGPDIYLPNAFTPNGDGLNDLYRGIPVGISQFNYLKIFNRWGEQIFYTTDYRKGWDGLWNGKQQNSGVFVVMVSGVDFLGNTINKKQTFLLIR